MKTSLLNKFGVTCASIILLASVSAHVQAGPGPQAYVPAMETTPENKITLGSVNSGTIIIDEAGKQRAVPATITHIGSDYVITEKNGLASTVSIPQSQSHN